MNFKVYGTIAAVIILSYFVYKAGQNSIIAGMADTIAEEVKLARKQEQIKQEKVNAVIQKQHDELVLINNSLNNDIERLRKRPSRADMSGKPKINCKGVNGTSLSFEDSRFLIREAARADKIRIALKACYKYADTIK